MVLATEQIGEYGNTPILTPGFVSQKLRLDEDLAEFMLGELSDSQGPLSRLQNGYSIREFYWR